MKKLFISQPMRGKTDEEILAVRQRAIESTKEKVGEDVEVIDSFFGASDMSRALEYLGENVKRLAFADVAYFAKGWQDARGCRIEHTCAVEYGIELVIEDYTK